MERQMSSEEILDAIKNMKNEERWKLLDKMYDLYYNIGPKIEDAPEEEDDY